MPPIHFELVRSCGDEDDAAAAAVGGRETGRTRRDVVEEKEQPFGWQNGFGVDRGDGGEVDLSEEAELASAPGRPDEAGRQVRRAAEARPAELGAVARGRGQAQAGARRAPDVGGAPVDPDLAAQG